MARVCQCWYCRNYVYNNCVMLNGESKRSGDRSEASVSWFFCSTCTHSSDTINFWITMARVCQCWYCRNYVYNNCVMLNGESKRSGDRSEASVSWFFCSTCTHSSDTINFWITMARVCQCWYCRNYVYNNCVMLNGESKRSGDRSEASVSWYCRTMVLNLSGIRIVFSTSLFLSVLSFGRKRKNQRKRLLARRSAAKSSSTLLCGGTIEQHGADFHPQGFIHLVAAHRIICAHCLCFIKRTPDENRGAIMGSAAHFQSGYFRTAVSNANDEDKPIGIVCLSTGSHHGMPVDKCPDRFGHLPLKQ